MAEIPPNTVQDPIGELARWFSTKAELAKLQAAEKLARSRLLAHFFAVHEPEGTVTYILPDGFQLKGVFGLDRAVDQASLEALSLATVGTMRNELAAAGANLDGAPDDMPLFKFLGIATDKLVVYKPELSVRAYRTLTDVQRKVFDLCLVVKPSSSQLKVEPPAKKGASDATA